MQTIIQELHPKILAHYLEITKKIVMMLVNIQKTC
jgi:hypothetical protein